jgi:hypothetical protein
MMQRTRFSLEQRFSFCKKVLSHFDKVPVYSYMLSSYTIDYVGTEFVIKTSGNEKRQVTVMFCIVGRWHIITTICDIEVKNYITHSCLWD